MEVYATKMEQDFDRCQGANTTYESSDEDNSNRNGRHRLKTRVKKSRGSPPIRAYDNAVFREKKGGKKW